jgi:hypothetical protein
MPITIQNNSISGIAAGGLPNTVITTALIADGAVTAAKITNGSTSSLGGAGDAVTTGGGYHRFPNGMIMQWSSYGGTAGEGLYTYSFPLTFPNACFRVTAGSTTPNADRDSMYQLDSFSTSQFTVYQNGINSAGGTQYPHIIAFGY